MCMKPEAQTRQQNDALLTRAGWIVQEVDRSNPGRQTLKEFEQYVTPDDGRTFSELYNVQRNHLDPVERACISITQRLASQSDQPLDGQFNWKSSPSADQESPDAEARLAQSRS